LKKPHLFCKITNHIGSRAARTAAQQDDTYHKIGRHFRTKQTIHTESGIIVYFIKVPRKTNDGFFNIVRKLSTKKVTPILSIIRLRKGTISPR
jgi:hypothetical protein